MSIEITTSELLEALAHATRRNGAVDARTVQELVESSQASPRRIREALHALHREGRLTAHKVRRIGIDGRNALVSAYTITPAKRKK